MPNNNTPGGTTHVKALADAAISRREGITVKVFDKGSAVRIRQQFMNMRNQHREFSRRIHPLEDPRYNTSPYDSITTRIEQKDGEFFLVFQTVLSELAEMEIIDNETKKKLNPEDL